jgi:hypothetical protein
MIDVGEGVNKKLPQIRRLYFMIDVGEGVKLKRPDRFQKPVGSF